MERQPLGVEELAAAAVAASSAEPLTKACTLVSYGTSFSMLTERAKSISSLNCWPHSSAMNQTYRTCIVQSCCKDVRI